MGGQCPEMSYMKDEAMDRVWGDCDEVKKNVNGTEDITQEFFFFFVRQYENACAK